MFALTWYFAAFTTDSSHVLFLTSTTTDAASGLEFGTLAEAPVTATSASQVVQLGTNVFQVVPATGAKVVFCQNFSATTFTCDIYVVDLSASTPNPTLLAAGANQGFAISSDRATIAYGSNAPSPGGLFTVAVP